MNFFFFWWGGGEFQLSFGEIFAAVLESGLDAGVSSSSPACLLKDLRDSSWGQCPLLAYVTSQFHSLREMLSLPPPPSVFMRPLSVFARLCFFSFPLDLWPSHCFIPLLLISLQRSHPCLFHFHLCLEVLHLFLWKNVPSYVACAGIINMENFFSIPFHSVESSSSPHIMTGWKGFFLLFLSGLGCYFLGNHRYACVKLNLLILRLCVGVGEGARWSLESLVSTSHRFFLNILLIWSCSYI